MTKKNDPPWGGGETRDVVIDVRLKACVPKGVELDKVWLSIDTKFVTLVAWDRVPIPGVEVFDYETVDVQPENRDDE